MKCESLAQNFPYSAVLTTNCLRVRGRSQIARTRALFDRFSAMSEHYVRNVGVEGSNPFCSTPQSIDPRTSRRIARNQRMRARFAITHGLGEYLCRPKLAESGETYPGAILLGRRIIATDSPAQIIALDLPFLVAGWEGGTTNEISQNRPDSLVPRSMRRVQLPGCL
jgi:hypothetical protein